MWRFEKTPALIALPGAVVVAANLDSAPKYRHQVSVATENGNGSVLHPECANSHSVASSLHLSRRLAGIRDVYDTACTPRERPRIMVSLSEDILLAHLGLNIIA